MSNLKQFNAQLRAFGKKVERGTERAVSAFGVELYRSLIDHTPRLTGHAQSGWNHSHGAPNYAAQAPGKDYYEPPPRTPANPQVKLGRTVYVANAVGHIGLLEAGVASPKAPFGITKPAIAALSGRLDFLLAREAPR